ncbi:MAG: hypothetical protein U1A77_19760 [Pirellulales bacterium]
MIVAVVPVLVGPLQTLIALAPVIFLAMMAALMVLFSPRGARAILRFLGRQPILLGLLAVTIAIFWSGYPSRAVSWAYQAMFGNESRQVETALASVINAPRGTAWTDGEFGGCVDDHAWPSSGRITWSESLGGAANSRVATPVCQGSFLVAARLDSDQMTLVVFDLEDPSQPRRRGELALDGSLLHLPLLVSGKAVLLSRVGAGMQAVGIDLKSMRELWRLELPWDEGDLPLRCVTERNCIFGLRQDRLLAIDGLSGELLHQRRLLQDREATVTNDASQEVKRDSYSLAVADGILAVGCDRRWWLVDAMSGRELSQGQAPHEIRSVQPAGGYFRFANTQQVSLIDPVQGLVTRLWSGRPDRRQLDLGAAMLSFSDMEKDLRILSAKDGVELLHVTGLSRVLTPVIGGDQVLLPMADSMHRCSLKQREVSEWFRWGGAEDAPATMLRMSQGRLYYGTKDRRIIAVAGADR